MLCPKPYLVQGPSLTGEDTEVWSCVFGGSCNSWQLQQTTPLGWHMLCSPPAYLSNDNWPGPNDHNAFEVLALLDLVHGCLPGKQVPISVAG